MKGEVVFTGDCCVFTSYFGTEMEFDEEMDEW